jgi:hypothetical protein
MTGAQAFEFRRPLWSDFLRRREIYEMTEATIKS